VQVVVLLAAWQLTTCVQRCAQPKTYNPTACVTALVLCAGGGAAGGLSADDLRAALRSAEDEDDAAAAAVAEKEAEAEMDEFTAEPPPEEAKDDDLEGLEGDDAPSRLGECWLSSACCHVTQSTIVVAIF
jgi:hypothetical protein